MTYPERKPIHPCNEVSRDTDALDRRRLELLAPTSVQTDFEVARMLLWEAPAGTAIYNNVKEL